MCLGSVLYLSKDLNARRHARVARELRAEEHFRGRRARVFRRPKRFFFRKRFCRRPFPGRFDGRAFRVVVPGAKTRPE